MHPAMPRQLTAGHIRELTTEADDARRAREPRHARRHRPPAHPRRSTRLYAQQRESRLGAWTLVEPGTGDRWTAAGREDHQGCRGRKAECRHRPRCPDALAPGRSAARIVTNHPGQERSLLCNGVVLFDDGGALLPGGRAVAPATAGLVRTAA
jgi:Family of unknown function (DUF5999)